MTVAVLSRTLDEELAAIVRGETVECLVCGEQAEIEGGRLECTECGSALERRFEPGPDQLALI